MPRKLRLEYPDAIQMRGPEPETTGPFERGLKSVALDAKRVDQSDVIAARRQRGRGAEVLFRTL
jgi:hypothetical protein